MTDAAGLIVGVIASWTTCVQAFDIVDSGRNYEMDYELLRVKLEAERIRLLHWGKAMGLGGVGHGPNAGLNREDVRKNILQLLGCIQKIFENSAKLQETHGLHLMAPNTSDQPSKDGRPLLAQQPPILDSVFEMAYEGLHRSAEDRRRATPLGKKAIWAIRDKKKFQETVLEIKEFNDKLEVWERLLQGVEQKTRGSINTDIGNRAKVRGLRGGTATARSASSGGAHIPTGEKEMLTGSQRAHQDLQAGRDSPDLGATSGGSGTGVDELSKEMEAVEHYIRGKSEGALCTTLSGPDSSSARVKAYVGWNGIQRDGKFNLKLSRLDEGKGFVQSSHGSFDLYRRKKSTVFPHDDGEDSTPPDEYILLDVECNPEYENLNPGTVTVEGFAMECWDYEEHFSRRGNNSILLSRAEIIRIPPKKLLRRLDELRAGNLRFGWDPNQEEADFKEFVGKMCVVRSRSSAGGRSKTDLLEGLCMLLNRRDIFANFTLDCSISHRSIGLGGEAIGLWDFVWQVVITTEFAWRLQRYPNVPIHGFTPRILASLIVADLWLRNVEIIMRDNTISMVDIKKPQTPLEEAKAECLKSQGNKAMKNRQYQEAVDLYTKAVKIDLSSAVYRANRSAALLSMEKFEHACTDAFIATQLDPDYAKAWARLGIAHLKLGNWRKARDAYQRAIEVAGDAATNLMTQGLAQANANIEAEIEAIERETNQAAKEALHKNYREHDWDTNGMTPFFRSNVHERQVEGLLIFAERMNWPYINEVRDFAEDAYAKQQSGEMTSYNLFDWLFGMTLPGKWMSHKIMTVLVLCTPSIAAEVDTAYYNECGLSIPQQTYWRVRTVLGRVLGCLPGVISLCGWIGPCPPVEFVPPLAESRPRHILLKARPITMMEHTPGSGDGVIYARTSYDQHEAIRIQPDEEPQLYLAEIKDHDHWVVPEPPVHEVSTCSIQAIRLRKLPLDIDVVDRGASKELSEKEVDQEVQYWAEIVFNMDDNEDPITYTLYTNPVFVTLPPCDGGRHEVHLREIPRYQKNIWTVERLKDHTAEGFDDVMVINATGIGTEVLARAWCSERGKNAVIRRSGGPCYVCAFRSASKAGLGVATLIWVS